MKKEMHIQIISVLLVTIAAISVLYKITNGFVISEIDENGKTYDITYSFDFEKAGESNEYFVKAFLPQNDSRQSIEKINNFNQHEFSNQFIEHNSQGVWKGTFKNEDIKKSIDWNCRVHLKPKNFNLNPNISLKELREVGTPYTVATNHIQSDHERILKIAHDLSKNKTSGYEVLQSFYNYVSKIPSRPIKQLTTALEVIDNNEASCNGKSRLFVALCRSISIPARVTGGIIMTDETKRTSHLWAEVKVNNIWVPFDTQNKHFAFLPANYLEIYTGDEFLITRSSNLTFDYEYRIASIEQNLSFFEEFNLFQIASKTGVTPSLLSLLMLLPIGALVVAIFRNVIGLKTFGVFLPVLMAISFLTTGVGFGIISFVGVLLLISLMHYPLNNWGILHVPKLVIMLIGVVLTMITLLFIGVKMNISQIGSITFFPIVILTISAEKYARVVVEEGFNNASKILLQTLFVTLFCFAVISSNTIYLILMNFPEVLLIVAVISIHLGKWIGLRISEFKRFNWILS